MRTTGRHLLVASILLVVYAFFIFDPSVEAAGMRVANLHRLSMQQNLLLVGGFGALAGLLMLIAARKEEKAVETPKHIYASKQVDVRDEQAEAFADAIRRWDVALMRKMLDRKEVSIHGSNRHGRGWLQYAVVIGALEPCRVLLEYGANCQDKDGFGRSAIYEAKAAGNADIAALFEST